jgi:septal ring factor EnvC (AmiA/AmiB activator)
MRKQVVAFLAAFVITGIVALSMLVVGVNAATNPNSVAASNSPASAVANVSTTPNSSQTQIAQLQSLVAQYQAREQQYQAALNSDNQQLSQASQEIQMIQQLLVYLQNRGLIQIDNQGQITVMGGSGN